MSSRIKSWTGCWQAVGVVLAISVVSATWAQGDPPPPPPQLSPPPSATTLAPPAGPQPQPDPDAYFGRRSKALSQEDRDALYAAEKSQTNYVRPVAAADGTLQFNYRGQAISVVCAVLQVCDIELQPGESVNNMNIGDPRIAVEPAVSGAGQNQTQHLVIKPLDVGIDTSLMVTTDRRTYYFRLKSDRREYMPRIAFTYSDASPASWVPPPTPTTSAVDPAKAAALDAAAVNQVPDPQALFFNYEIDGHAEWKPVRVYSDGIHTFIQMPKSMSQTEAPTLLVIRDKKEQVIVNYRVQGDRYIVDSVFKKAILIAGVGHKQTRVTITRDGEVG